MSACVCVCARMRVCVGLYFSVCACQNACLSIIYMRMDVDVRAS